MFGLGQLGNAAGGAVKGAIGGIANLGAAEDQEERARREALRQLSSRFQNASASGSTTFGFAPELPKAPGVGEAIVKPMVAGAAQGAVSGALGDKEEDDPNFLKNMAKGYLGR